MISLVLRGKLSLTEDVLTAAVLDHVRQQPVALLRELLLLARPAIDVPHFDEAKYELWPQTPVGEPDARLTLFAARQPVATIVIEAKLGARKSGEGEIHEVKAIGDQLARYWAHEQKRASSLPVTLIYLTQHAAAPREDLLASVQVLTARGTSFPGEPIVWLSWREVHTVLRTSGADVVELLRRAGMIRFQRFALPAFVAQPPHFYQAAPLRVRVTAYDFAQPPELGLLPQLYRQKPARPGWPPPPELGPFGWVYEQKSAETAWPLPPELSSPSCFYEVNR